MNADAQGFDAKIDSFFKYYTTDFFEAVFYSVNVPGFEDQKIKLILVWLSLAAVFFSLYLLLF